MEKRKIELFTAGCPVCDPVIEMVKSMACNNCDVIIYNIADKSNREEYMKKIKSYNIETIPSVAVNGKLLSCCENKGVNREDLEKAGVGQPYNS